MGGLALGAVGVRGARIASLGMVMAVIGGVHMDGDVAITLVG
jgi:hypothetical protein